MEQNAFYYPMDNTHRRGVEKNQPEQIHKAMIRRCTPNVPLLSSLFVIRSMDVGVASKETHKT